MLEDKVTLAINNFIKPCYVNKISSYYDLIEKGNKQGQGKSLLKCNVGTDDNICVSNYDDKDRCEFFTSKWGLRKCIDHFILKKQNNNWELHMIEMKTTVNRDNWEGIKEKFRASYWNILILTQFLGISFDIENVFLYTTYECEDMSIAESSNPRGNILRLGGYISDTSKEWNGEILTSIRLVPYDDRDEAIFKFKHTKIQMKRSDDGWLKGEYPLQ